MLLSSSDTRRTLMHLFLFTNSALRELVSICTQSITTAINFLCISTLPRTICCIKYVFKLTILINIFHLPTPYYAGDRDFTKNKHKLTSHSQDRNSLIKRTASSCFHPRLSSSIRKGFPLVNLSSGSDGFNNRIYFRRRHKNQCQFYF